MTDRETLELENRLLKCAGRGESVFASAYGDKTILVTDGQYDAPIAVEFDDIHPRRFKAVIDGLNIPSIKFYDLPRLTVEVTGPDFPDMKVNAAATVMAAWLYDHGDLFDELCIYVWDDWMGYPGAAMAGPIARKIGGLADAESSDDFEGVEVFVARRSFADWIRALRASNDEDVAHFGEGLHRSYRHFRNHDLEGNRYNRAGEVVDNDGVSLA